MLLIDCCYCGQFRVIREIWFWTNKFTQTHLPVPPHTKIRNTQFFEGNASTTSRILSRALWVRRSPFRSTFTYTRAKMATNAASYNPSKSYTLAFPDIISDKKTESVGEETDPVSGKPPPLSNETKAAVAGAANASTTGSHVPGQGAEKKIKTEKELERERKKAEKDAKFKEKKAKAAAAAVTPATISKTAEKKPKPRRRLEQPCRPTSRRHLLAQRKLSSPLTIRNTKRTTQLPSNPHGMPGGRRRGFSSPSLPQTAKSSQKANSLSSSHLRMSLESCIWVTLLAMPYKM
jgi:hypothetical protein